ncbi:MAG: glycine cleavage T C-terminal barrel domain-containing protein [Gemmatimonadaceae bacterium]
MRPGCCWTWTTCVGQEGAIEGRSPRRSSWGSTGPVSFDKPQFNGRLALRAERAAGASWKFIEVEVDWPSLERQFNAVGLAPRLPAQATANVPLYDANGAAQVGYATSGCWSPLLKRYIALAHVEARYAANTPLMMEVTVEHRQRAEASVRALPFFNPERKRARAHVLGGMTPLSLAAVTMG